jgi:hypothetical protein
LYDAIAVIGLLQAKQDIKRSFRHGHINFFNVLIHGFRFLQMLLFESIAVRCITLLLYRTSMYLSRLLLKIFWIFFKAVSRQCKRAAATVRIRKRRGFLTAMVFPAQMQGLCEQIVNFAGG